MSATPFDVDARAFESPEDSRLYSDLMLRLEFLRIVDELGIDRAERLLANVRETLKSPGTIGDPRR